MTYIFRRIYGFQKGKSTVNCILILNALLTNTQEENNICRILD